MARKLRRFIKGYVRVQLTGEQIYRLLNMCRTHSFVLYNITEDTHQVSCDIFVDDFFAMLPLFRRTRTRIKVLDKVGLPFYMKKGRKRICFLLCLCACLFFLHSMDSYVWAIEYIGNLQISNDELKDFISEENIYYGMKKKDLQLEEVEKHLREEFPVVTWTSIYLEGTKLCVEIKENDVAQYEKLTDTGGSNLVASSTGTITSIITRNGVPKVKAGDQVEEGQILVEGLVPVYDESLVAIDYQLYEADADIYINTLVPYSDTIERNYSVMKYTGREQKCYFIEMAGHRIEFPGYWKNLLLCEKISQKWQCSVLEDIYLPVFYGNVIYREYEMEQLAYTESEMKNMLYENFQHFMETLEGKGVQIIEKNVKISNNAQGMTMEGEVLVNQKTGVSVAIDEPDYVNEDASEVGLE